MNQPEEEAFLTSHKKRVAEPPKPSQDRRENPNNQNTGMPRNHIIYANTLKVLFFN